MTEEAVHQHMNQDAAFLLHCVVMFNLLFTIQLVMYSRRPNTGHLTVSCWTDGLCGFARGCERRGAAFVTVLKLSSNCQM